MKGAVFVISVLCFSYVRGHTHLAQSLVHHVLEHVVHSHDSHSKGCGHYRSSPISDAGDIRDELLAVINQANSVASEPAADLINKAEEIINELLDDGNSTARSGRGLAKEAPSSFVDVLQTADEILEPTDRLDEQLLASKYKLVETTKETLREFLSDLAELAEMSLSDDDEEAKEILQAEETLIEKTKESYETIYENTARMLRKVAESSDATLETKKMIAARVIDLATHNIHTVSDLRRRIYTILARIAERAVVGHMTHGHGASIVGHGGPSSLGGHPALGGHHGIYSGHGSHGLGHGGHGGHGDPLLSLIPINAVGDGNQRGTNESPIKEHNYGIFFKGAGEGGMEDEASFTPEEEKELGELLDAYQKEFL